MNGEHSNAREAPTTERRRTFRGAKVGTSSTTPVMSTALHPQVEHYSAIGYELAMANRHKNWAKRWFKAHRSGVFR